MNSANIKIAKVREGARIPVKREEDAAFDLWSAEGFDTTIQPHSVTVVDTGIATTFDSDWVAVIKGRSGNASKGIMPIGGVIDSHYHGNWKVCLINLTDEVVYIPKEKAIAQFLMLPVPKVNMEEVSYQEILDTPSERGTNGFGSTDKRG